MENDDIRTARQRLGDWMSDPENPIFRIEPHEYHLNHWARPSTWRAVGFLSTTFSLTSIALIMILQLIIDLAQ